MTLGRLTAALRARGHVVSIVRPRLRPSFWLEVAGELDTTWVPGAPVPGYRDVRLGWPATRRLAGAWRAHRPEAVYVATPGPLGWAAVRTARRLGIRVFSGYHTNFADYARHYGARWLARGIGAGLRAFHNRTLGTLVPSVDLMRRLRTTGFENLTVLGRGVDCRLFNPTRRDSAVRAQWGAESDDLVALYVGRIAAEKNVALAIETYRAMKRAGLARQLVVVGDGPLRETLQRAHPDVLFCGAQTGVALATHYASADVFLFPSETETFGNVVLEAMASGLAVIAYDYAAAGAHLRAGDSGVLVPRGPGGAFVSAAVEAARAPATVARMRERARGAALALDWDAVVDGFERFLSGGEIADARAHHRDAGGRPTASRPRRAPDGVRARPEKEAWHGAH
jgi:glycosyltransferase involved in cell wall biosynthesis